MKCTTNQIFYLIVEVGNANHFITADDGDFDRITSSLKHKYVREIIIDEGNQLDEYFCFSLDIDPNLLISQGIIGTIYDVKLYDNPLGSDGGQPALHNINVNQSILIVYPQNFSSIIIGTNSFSVNSVSSLLVNGVIDPIEFSNLTINGTLVVDTDWIIQGGQSGLPSIISMFPGSQIIVEDYNELTISGSNVHGCDQLWQSILVHPLAKLNVNNSIISNAEMAIEFLIDPTTGESGFVNLNRVSLESNKIGVEIPNTTPSQNVNLFFSNNFINYPLEAGLLCNTLILPSYGAPNRLRQGISSFGIRANSTAGLFVDGNLLVFKRQSVGVSASNYSQLFVNNTHFYLGGTGVRSTTGSKVSVFNCSFENLIYGVSRMFGASNTLENNFFEKVNTGYFSISNIGQASTVLNNEFMSCRIGIHSAIERPAVSTTIDNCNMSNIGSTFYQGADDNGAGILFLSYGLSSGFSPLLQVTNNFMQLNRAANGFNASNVNHSFVYNNEVSRASMNDNLSGTFSGMKVTSGSNQDYRENKVDLLGIDGRSSAFNINGTTNYSLNCNEANHTWNGYLFFGQNLGQFRTNESKVHGTGLQVLADAYMSPQNFRGNLWLNSSVGSFQAENDNQQIALINASRFIVNGALGSSFHPINNHPISTWFDESPFASNEICNTELYDLIEFTAIDTLIALGEKDIFLSGRSMEFEALKNLIRKLPADFYQVEPWSHLPDLESFNIAYSYNLIDQLWGEINNLEAAQVNALNDEINNIYNEMANASNEYNSMEIDSETYIETIRILNLSLKSLSEQRRILYLEWSEYFISELEKIEQYLLSLPIIHEYHYYELYTQLALLDLLNNGEDGLSAEYVSTLNYIASLCPLSAGKGVYLARDLIAKTDYDDSDICSLTEPRSNSSSFIDESLNYLSVYPNPVTSYLKVSVPTSGKIYIYDMRGVLLFSQEVNNNGDWDIDFHFFPQGVYS